MIMSVSKNMNARVRLTEIVNVKVNEQECEFDCKCEYEQECMYEFVFKIDS